MTHFKLYSWNINGIRAQEKKGFINWMENLDCDIIGLQETKAHKEQLSDKLLNIQGYQSYFKSGERKGYSGVAIYSKIKPLRVIDHFDHEILNSDGRLIGLEFDKFFIFIGYFPNGGRGIEWVQHKINFYNAFYDMIESLSKPVIFGGDINTAHHEIDLARPNENRNTSGFMDIEREWLHFITEKGYIDTYRHFHPNEIKYTWWDQKTKSRERNVGWRIDYFFVQPTLKQNLISAEIHDQILGSDHCPISLEIEI
ncbi:exodeoxyribonuclease III [Candidatus Peregrinibacteria bacterium]|nr:exodeoxyribonuclease III [Candidatus Peregrinibacteria bacterium]